MLWTFNVFFHKDIVDAEGFLCFVFRAGKSCFQIFFFLNDSHSSAAAACCCFQHDRITADLGDLMGFRNGIYGFVDSWNHWNANFSGNQLGLDLISETFHHFCGRADKFNADLFAFSGKFRILREESITWMNGIYALL